MITEFPPINLVVIQRLFEDNPTAFEALMLHLGSERPRFGDVTLRFVDGRFTMVDVHSSHK